MLRAVRPKHNIIGTEWRENYLFGSSGKGFKEKLDLKD